MDTSVTDNRLHSGVNPEADISPRPVSQTGDSAGFQVSLPKNQIELQMNVFIEISLIWVQVEHKVDGNSGTAPT
ncbi:hypothetical protein CSKR_102847 [Clonorchis sinensis]|uniref:Uncharacterized protein n=1 Tax=Clonorchis sinensis TaxID=79923 RepID=A0A3R7H721_CLOSI|nr:hypothetical protein CSKR_102847 [Clonorchis sinensis]